MNSEDLKISHQVNFEESQNKFIFLGVKKIFAVEAQEKMQRKRGVSGILRILQKYHQRSNGFREHLLVIFH